MRGFLPFAGDNVVNDLCGCFGLEKECVLVDLYVAGKGAVDVIDRQERRGPELVSWEEGTYDKSADEVLDAVSTEVEVGVCVGELGEGYGGLLLADGTAGEVWLGEDARGVRGTVELDALVGALRLVFMKTRSVL